MPTQSSSLGGGIYRTPRAVLDAIGLHMPDCDCGCGGWTLALATSPGKTLPATEILKLLGNPPFEERHNDR